MRLIIKRIILCISLFFVFDSLSAADLLIDDFEDGNFVGSAGGIWQAINDSATGGNSICNHKLTNGYSSLYSIRHEYTLGSNYIYRNTFEQLSFGTNRDFWNGFVSLNFKIRGSGHSLRIKFATPATIANYNYYGYTISSTPGTWTEYSINLSDLQQEDWGPGSFSNTESHRKNSIQLVSELQFVANSQIVGETGWFEIDDVYFKSVNVSNCQIGAFVDSDNNGTDASDIDNYESIIGKNLASVMFFINWGNGIADNFPLTTCNIIDANGSVPHITWEPYTTNIQVSIFDGILAGNYDSYITSFANSVKSWGKPLWIRFAHEMNGNWYGWSGFFNGANLSAVSKYTQTWRYVWRKFKEVGATNVAWVWSPGNESIPTSQWNAATNYYPGDDFVNWIGISGYNWFTNNGGLPQNRSFDDIFSAIYVELSKINSDKPMMISEFASEDFNTGITKKSNWIIDAFLKIKYSYPRIRNYNWFNINKERAWRIDSPNSGNPSAAKIAMQDPYFVSTGDPFIKGITYSPPPVTPRFIDDFEDGNWTDKNGGTWQAINDSSNGGNSVASVKFTNGAGGSTYAAKFIYTLGANYQYRYAFFSTSYGSFNKNFSSYSNISFRLVGSGHKLRVIIVTANITDNDFYGYNIETTAVTNWKEYTINLKDFSQEGWGTHKSFDLTQVIAIQFKASSQINGEEGWFAIDDIEFGTNVVIPETPPVSSVIDDFEDGNWTDKNNGTWQAINDSGDGGNSVASVKFTNGAGGSTYAAKFIYTLGNNAYPYRYAFLSTSYPVAKDFSSYSNISFHMKGSGNKVRILLITDGFIGYDYYGYNINSTSTSEWKEYRLNFKDFSQEGWGTSQPLDLSKIKAIQFKASSMIPGESGWFAIDNISLGTDVIPPPVFSGVVDDFEDNDLADNNGGTWFGDNDSYPPNNGNSTISVKLTNIAYEGEKAIYASYTLGPAYQYRYVLLMDSYSSAKDYSNYKSISFAIKGSGHKVKVIVGTENITDYDYYGYDIGNTMANWTVKTLYFKNFQQEGWGSPKSFDLSKVKSFMFKASSMISGEQGWFIIDNVVLSTQGPPDQTYSIIDDFEDGDGNNKIGGVWISVDDSANGGDSVVYPPKGLVTTWTAQGYNSNIAGYFSYTLGPSYSYRYAFLQTSFPSATDISFKSNISLKLKGSGHKMRVVLISDEVTDYDYHGITIPATPIGVWTCYTLYFSDFRQEGWGEWKDIKNALKKVKSFQFKASSMIPGESGFFYIDDIRLGSERKPVDLIPPGNITNFSITVTNSDSLLLRWENPLDIDLAGVIIYRTTSEDYDWLIYGDPVDASVFQTSDIIYKGPPIESFLDTKLETGVTYLYFIRPYDTSSNFNNSCRSSDGSRGRGVPVDTEPPSPPKFVEYYPYPSLISGANVLKWQNPLDHDFKGVKVLRKTNGFSTDENDGDLVIDIPNILPGSITTYTDTAILTDGTKYYYTLFAYDDVFLYSSTNSLCKAFSPIATISVSNLTKINSIHAGEKIKIEGSASGSVGFSAKVFYNLPEDFTNYSKFISMRKIDENRFIAEIPVYGSPGIFSYKIQVEDQFGNKVTVKGNDIEIIAPVKDTVEIFNTLVDFSKGETFARIRFSITSEEPLKVIIKIYSPRGQLIKDLTNKQELYSDGVYYEDWDATDLNNQPVAPGVYLVYVQAGKFKSVKKIMVVR